MSYLYTMIFELLGGFVILDQEERQVFVISLLRGTAIQSFLLVQPQINLHISRKFMS